MLGKFRVWATSDEHPNGRMYYIGDDHIYPNGVKTSFVLNMNGDLVELYEGKGHYKDRDCSLVWARIGFNDVDVMFYIGLEDVNHKEIYDNDILKLITGSPELQGKLYQVKWHQKENQSAEFGLFGIKGITNFRFPIGAGHFYVKVGDIYQNPELIKANEKK